MAYKIFLDINILADFFDSTRSGHKNAIRLFQKLEGGELTGYVSESVLNTLSYILRKHIKVDDLKILLSRLLSFISILKCDNKIYQNGLYLPGNDIEDLVLYQLALEHKMDYFISSDKKGFAKITGESMPVISLAELLSRLS